MTAAPTTVLPVTVMKTDQTFIQIPRLCVPDDAGRKELWLVWFLYNEKV